MQLTILKPGFLSTVQDMGRYLHLAQAIPVSGAMDTLSARIANKCVGNNDNAAVLEFTYSDIEFIAETDLLIACVGDGAILNGGGQMLPQERPLYIPAATKINFINSITGSRTYLGVAGGWDVPDVLNSKSTFLTAGFGGMEGRALKAGDILNSETPLEFVSQQIYNKLKGNQISYLNWSVPRQSLLPLNRKIIRVVPANEFTWFNSRSIVDFLTEPYMVGYHSNRMGYHLEGKTVNCTRTEELLSTAVTPGTIQVTGSGSLIILMADCQTTGGYPRIAQVAAVDLPLCGQLKPGDLIYFNEISRQEAEKLYIERENQLRKLTIAIKSKFV